MQTTQDLKPGITGTNVIHRLRALLAICLLLLSACGTARLHPKQTLIPSVTKPPESTKVAIEKTPVLTLAPIHTKPPTQAACAAELPLDHRVGQLMFPLVFQSEFMLATKMASNGMLGGVVVLGNPNASIRDDIALYQKRSLFGPGIIAVDEEGGRVQRLSAITSVVPSARKVALTLGPDQARQLAADHAVAIGQLGFTMNLAPVADLDNSQAIGDRSFGRDPITVSAFAMATAQGILDAGLLPVLKHFPGHGRGSDSHFGLPVIPAVDVLRQTDLVPFIEASEREDIPIMIGHLVVEGLTDGQPASVSNEAVNGLLRDELGFDGLVMTDAFNMDAIAAKLSDAEAARAVLARIP